MDLQDGREKDTPRGSHGADARLAKLQEQEQFWFSWLIVLHERLTKMKPGQGAFGDGKKVLEIARQRWLEAREALRQHRAED